MADFYNTYDTYNQSKIMYNFEKIFFEFYSQIEHYYNNNCYHRGLDENTKKIYINKEKDFISHFTNIYKISTIISIIETIHINRNNCSFTERLY